MKELFLQFIHNWFIQIYSQFLNITPKSKLESAIMSLDIKYTKKTFKVTGTGSGSDIILTYKFSKMIKDAYAVWIHIHYSKKLKEHDQHHLWYVDTLRSSC